MPSNAADVQIKGLPQLIRACNASLAGLDDMKAANARAAQFVAQAAKARAPHDTGRLIGAIRGNTAARRAVVSVPGVRYAKPVHVGWTTSRGRRIPGYEFISDAAHATENLWVDAYYTDLQRIVDRIADST